MSTKLRRNTPAEDAAINRRIARDRDNPELTDAFFASGRPAAEMLPPGPLALVSQHKGRGPGKKPAKAVVTMRLDQDVVDHLRASGPGWQSRANTALRKLVSA